MGDMSLSRLLVEIESQKFAVTLIVSMLTTINQLKGQISFFRQKMTIFRFCHLNWLYHKGTTTDLCFYDQFSKLFGQFCVVFS